MKLCLALLLAVIVSAQEFTVRETAGLRRFGYPVRAELRLPAGGPLTLLEDGKPVPAQFTPRGSGMTEIDFAVSLGPHESRKFRVEKGTPPAAASSMQCEETADSLIARQPGGLAFTFPKDLAGLLREASSPKLTYLRPGSVGLGMSYRDGSTQRPPAPTRSEISKSGVFVCGFRFEAKGSTVDVEVPRTKSWVEVRWNTEDPDGRIAGLFADLNLAVEPPRTLVDFGASSYVYVALRPGEDARMRAASGGWSIDVGGQPYASGKGHVEGWAHAMDATRATAVSVEEFGKGSAEDEMLVQSDGRLLIRRNGLSGAPKRLHFWVHFVGMPVQVGAATSPQSMMAPLEIRLP